MPFHRLSLVVVAATALACGAPESSDVADTGDSVPASDTAMAASCLPFVPEVRGSLVGQRAPAQREARRVRVAGVGIARTDSGGARITIAPACGSHTFRAEDLARGQFVARLTIDGNAPRFSPVANDTVYWWVYLDLRSGAPVFHSEFLSMAAASDTGRSYLRRGDFIIRCKPQAARPKAEMAGWEQVHPAEACPRSEAVMRFVQAVSLDSGTQGSGGSSPWFGCTLGCCQSSRILDEQ